MATWKLYGGGRANNQGGISQCEYSDNYGTYYLKGLRGWDSCSEAASATVEDGAEGSGNNIGLYPKRIDALGGIYNSDHSVERDRICDVEVGDIVYSCNTTPAYRGSVSLNQNGAWDDEYNEGQCASCGRNVTNDGWDNVVNDDSYYPWFVLRESNGTAGSGIIVKIDVDDQDTADTGGYDIGYYKQGRGLFFWGLSFRK